eukprot:COSAG04_NODE_34_length_34523_cov_40.302446_22_plen_104_part_00
MRVLVDHSLIEAFASGAKNAFLEQSLHYNDHFSQTGGLWTNIGKVEGKEALRAGRGSVSGFAPRLAMDYEPNATGVALESSCEGVGATARLWEMRAAELVIQK